jgi:tetratricopeptide (TPR) repeat protein/nitrate/TMAO reductase-like tetraheme cytochrome c subunit
MNYFIVTIVFLIKFTQPSVAKIPPQESIFVGAKVCANCHESQFKMWQGSHHDMSMRHAEADSVLGDFNNVVLEFNGEKNKFYKEGKEYWVNIKGDDGKFHHYQIKYTFGYEPLQQYMVELDNGRIQLIPFAWDSRAKVDGGQRWFNLYPEFTDSREEFFWTNTGQNWNYMCADCHSTNVSKNFDLDSKTYSTTYSEINVACEACHGPGSEHINWSKNKDDTIAAKGFNRTLTKSVTHWVKREGKNTLMPEKIIQTQQTLVCAQCHSRHVQISENDYINSNAFGERYMLNMINSEQYHADGQVYDEVFVYGSFLQSKMARNGVTCTNCHNPHSNELVIPKEAVCLQCHDAENYAKQSHHKHQESGQGAQCVNCHMPETTFMKVDRRADHSWHIPRPDLSERIGTPDTCLNCHSNKDSKWSAQQIVNWYPNSAIRSTEHFAPAFAAVDAGYAQAASVLSHIAQNKDNADIIRASALERMAPIVNANTLIAIARGAKDKNEFVRLAAIRGARNLPIEERWRILAPLLKDKVLAIRIEAAYMLTSLWGELSNEQQKALQPTINEYMSAQSFNNDRGFSHSNQGTIFAYQRQYQLAEKAFKTSIAIEPNFSQAYINLAELYRRMGHPEKKTIELLTQGTIAVVNNSSIHYSLGLAYIREKQADKAAIHFSKAVDIEPNNAQYHYVLGLVLEKLDLDKAQVSLRNAFKVSSDPRQLYALCDMQVRHQIAKAKECIEELSQIAPKEIVQRLQNQLSQGN